MTKFREIFIDNLAKQIIENFANQDKEAVTKILNEEKSSDSVNQLIDHFLNNLDAASPAFQAYIQCSDLPIKSSDVKDMKDAIIHMRKAFGENIVSDEEYNNRYGMFDVKQKSYGSAYAKKYVEKFYVDDDKQYSKFTNNISSLLSNNSIKLIDPIKCQDFYVKVITNTLADISLERRKNLLNIASHNSKVTKAPKEIKTLEQKIKSMNIIGYGFIAFGTVVGGFTAIAELVARKLVTNAKEILTLSKIGYIAGSAVLMGGMFGALKIFLTNTDNKNKMQEIKKLEKDLPFKTILRDTNKKAFLESDLCEIKNNQTQQK